MDPSLYVLAAGYAIASLVVLIPLLAWGTRMRLRHGDRAPEVGRAAIRAWLGGR